MVDFCLLLSVCLTLSIIDSHIHKIVCQSQGLGFVTDYLGCVDKQLSSGPGSDLDLEACTVVTLNLDDL